MQKLSTPVARATIFGALLTLPLVALEIANRRQYAQPFPFLLFALLWGLASLAGGAGFASWHLWGRWASQPRPRKIALYLLCLLGCGILWAAIVGEQLPCFLGVPICD